MTWTTGFPSVIPASASTPTGGKGLPRHDDCQGGVVTCECWTEVLIEAEEMTE